MNLEKIDQYNKAFWRFRQNNRFIPFVQAIRIFNENPNIRILHTFQEWNDIERRILKGSKGIKLYDNGVCKYYFDISSTKGRPYHYPDYVGAKHIVKVIDDINETKLEQDFTNLYSAVHKVVTNYITDRHPEFASQKDIIDVTAKVIYSCVGGEVTDFSQYEEKILNTSDYLMGDIYQSIEENKAIKKENKANARIESVEEQRRIGPSVESVQRGYLHDRRTTRDGETRNQVGRETILGQMGGESVGDDERVQSETRGYIDIRDELGGVLQEHPRGSVDAHEQGNGESERAIDERKGLSQEVAGINLRADDGRGDNYQRNNRAENYDRSKTTVSAVGAKARFKANIQAIKLVKELSLANITIATPEQQEILAQYVGWGGLPQAFDSTNVAWADEYKELKEILTEKEYESARSSTLSAHYTSNEIIQSMYNGLQRLGFSNGKLLEPACGIGNIIGNAPKSIDKNNIYGVELDNITGEIAKYLYPESNIQIKGFEETAFDNGTFDAVVTNVPFGNFKVFDKDYVKENLFIHDYFISKGLDKTKAGGVCAFITSKGTLDKQSVKARTIFAKKAELLGAIRLPNTAFKAQAGTEVVADVLFFKKRENYIDNPTDSWINSSVTEEGIKLNNYFIEHPEMILGTMKKQKSMYGSDDETTCEPFLDKSLSELLEKAVLNLPENVFSANNVIDKSTSNALDNQIIAPPDDNIRNYTFFVKDDNIFYKKNDTYTQITFGKTVVPRIKDLIKIKEQVRNLIDIQLRDCSDEELHTEQERLNVLYDNFVKKYGFLSLNKNIEMLSDDVDYALLSTIESYDKSTNTAEKEDIFTKRTIRRFKPITSVETANEALLVCLSETGKVDIKKIENLCNKNYDEVIAELQGKIYRNPEVVFHEESSKYDGWETAEQYLSGNVKSKLLLAKEVGKDNGEFLQNITALEAVLPEEIPAHEINVRLGATWIDKEIYEDFIKEKFDTPWWNREQVKIDYNSFEGEWSVDAKVNSVGYYKNHTVYGTDRMTGVKIFEHCLNQSTINVYDTLDDKKRVLNKKETALAREKARVIQEEFKSWIFDNTERRRLLVEKYNKLFNNIVLPKFDGSYLTFPGMNCNIQLRKHQVDAVHRILSNGNTLLHHCVGAGKTYTICAAALKARQYGLATKPMIVVPNHLVKQWAEEFTTLYPNAKVLMTTKKNFDKNKRLEYASKIATGDWDAIIIGQSAFERIPMSEERVRKELQDEISNIRTAIDYSQEEGKRLTIKKLESTLKKKEEQLKKRLNSPKDNLLNFEQLGVDYLFVDEAHYYKNKGVFTKMSNVAGISTAASKRAQDMDMKCKYINEIQGGEKGVVFATGTPISNSMSEMYVMQSYLQRQTLKENGIEFFDGWAGVFGETVTALELAPSGNGYRTKTRFAKFTNLPELQKLYRSFADVKTADMLNLPVPECEKIVIKTPATPTTTECNNDIMERAERIQAKSVTPEEDNMLKITSDGKKLALDPRLYYTEAPDEPESKLNACINNVYNIWKDTAGDRLAQVIFCDMSVPKCSFEDYRQGVDFDVYNEIKTKLVEMGVPANEIRYIHEAGDNENKKEELFNDVRNGNIRVIIGSTAKCGAGTNMQDKLYALHHLDTPYRPADLEQREGRIVRQGNTCEKVKIFTYVTEKTFDSYSYQLLENKQKFISQINAGDMNLREAKDIDEETLNYGEIKALVTNNPLIKRKMELEQEIQRLAMLESEFYKKKYALQDSLANKYPGMIEKIKTRIANMAQDIEMRNNNIIDSFAIVLHNKMLTERVEAGEVLLNLSNSLPAGTKIGTYCGFNLVTTPTETIELLTTIKKLKLVGVSGEEYFVEMSESPIGNIAKIENCVKGLENRKEDLERKLETTEIEYKQAQEEVVKDFEHKNTLLELRAELSNVDSQLDLDKKEEVIIEDVKEDNIVLREPIVRVYNSNMDSLPDGDYDIRVLTNNMEKLTSISEGTLKYRIICNVNNEEYQFSGCYDTKEDTSLYDNIQKSIERRKQAVKAIEDDDEKSIAELDLNYQTNVMIPYLKSYTTNDQTAQLKQLKSNIKAYNKLKQDIDVLE